MWRFLLTCLVILPIAARADAVRIGPPEARQPQLAVSADAIYCAFGQGDEVYCARSTDGGASFEESVRIAHLPGLMLGMRRGPRIAARGDAVVITAISRHAGDLVAWRSVDAGRTWSEPARVNDSERACREGLHDLAVREGEFRALWLDLRAERTELWSSVSTDGGATWSPNGRVYRSPGGSVCECCHPSLSASEGTWLALWRDNIDGNRDMFALPLAGDAPAEPAMRLGTTHWALAACPMDGGDVASHPAGGEWAVWRREKSCYVTNLRASARRERRLGEGEQPVVAVTKAGPTFAWITRRKGDLLVLPPKADEPTKLASGATDPSIVATVEGRLVVAWEMEGGIEATTLGSDSPAEADSSPR